MKKENMNYNLSSKTIDVLIKFGLKFFQLGPEFIIPCPMF